MEVLRWAVIFFVLQFYMLRVRLLCACYMLSSAHSLDLSSQSDVAMVACVAACAVLGGALMYKMNKELQALKPKEVVYRVFSAGSDAEEDNAQGRQVVTIGEDPSMVSVVYTFLPSTHPLYNKDPKGDQEIEDKNVNNLISAMRIANRELPGIPEETHMEAVNFANYWNIRISEKASVGADVGVILGSGAAACLVFCACVSLCRHL